MRRLGPRSCGHGQHVHAVLLKRISQNSFPPLISKTTQRGGEELDMLGREIENDVETSRMSLLISTFYSVQASLIPLPAFLL